MNKAFSLQSIINSSIAREYSIVPLTIRDTEVVVGYTNEAKKEQIALALKMELKKEVVWRLLNDDELEKHQRQLYRSNRASPELYSESQLDIQTLLVSALNMKASDLHLDPEESGGLIRLRIDGKLIRLKNLSIVQSKAFINQLKIAARLDIAEKRLPQDGRTTIKTTIGDVDARVSILPCHYGEKAVVRLLTRSQDLLDIEKVGLSPLEYQAFQRATSRNSGLVLISGPTGSGKTTTLYASLNKMNAEHMNILTVEDPIEYTLAGINQVQCKNEIGLDFQRILRTMLRQDPDVIMVGEIRDVETAQIALRASLTGHLVLATIHTNSSWSTIARLLDMGLPFYLILDALSLSMAQRLIRLLCQECKQPLNHSERTFGLEIPDGTLVYGPQGCDHCYQTGYSGRKAIYEMIEFNYANRQLAKEGLSSDQRPLFVQGSLREAAISAYFSGLTSFEEIMPYTL